MAASRPPRPPSASVPRAWICVVTLLLLAPPTLGAPPGPNAAATPAEPAAITLSAATVPATGAQTVQVRVARFGRYALSVASAQGTALQLVDRMAGPGAVSGQAGARNGRIDAFLERGEYRLRVLSDAKGTGEARVEARAFTEVNGARAPLLPDVVETSATLKDLEQRSWWIQLDADEDFVAELAGRSLADVRLWRDGTLLDPAAAECEEVAPDPKRPLRRCVLHARLGAGLWQLVAYGGPALPWAVSDGDQPLHVRRGLPTLASAGRLSGVVSPFGVDRWRVPGVATSFRLELPSGADAAVAVRAFDPADPLRDGGSSAPIGKATMPPVATLALGASSEDRVVTVSGAAGQPYVLQHFPGAGRVMPVRGSGSYFLTTLHGGDPADAPDVTGVLTQVRRPGAPPPPPLAASLLPLGSDIGYRRRFNLLGPTTLGFEVATDTRYTVSVSAPGVSWRWEPLLDAIPAGYAAPPLLDGPGSTSLTPGRWTLTLSPKTAGIAEVTVAAEGAAQPALSAPRANFQLPAVALDATREYTLTLGQGGDGGTGLVLRSLPADLAEPLPVTLGPDQSVTVPSVMPSAGMIAAGGGLEVSVDGGAAAASVEVKAGSHVVTIHNPTSAVAQGTLSLAPAEGGRAAPLPPLPDTAVVTAPVLPILSAARPQTLDLGAGDSASFALRVDTDGLYRIESTGLLATAGAVRTRTNPVLAAAAVNGVGRNFLLQRYLREGDYQVTVATQGASAGHLGVRLEPTALRDGGLLRVDQPGRATVPAGEGIVYRFDAPEAGDYEIRSFGQGGPLHVRVEDADGWPLLAPDTEGDLRVTLPAGPGRLLLLPEPVDTTRITTFTRVDAPVERVGHGPHALPLDVPASLVWWEPAAREDRAPDVWRFDLRAPTVATITAGGEGPTGEMEGSLYRAGATDPVAILAPGRPWTGALAAGAYRLELTSARRNSGVAYTVRMSPHALVPGVSRALDAPVTVPVSVGDDGLVELGSMGVADVRARLYDGAGRLVAASDDRPDDWNFRLSARLAPGLYALRVDPVGASAGQTLVTYALGGEADAPALTAGQTRTMTVGGDTLRVPLQLPGGGAGDALLVVSAASAENLSLAVETLEDGLWRTVAEGAGTAPRLVARLGAPDRRWRLRLAAIDGRGLPATLAAGLVSPRSIGEGALGAGATLPVDNATGVAAAIVTRARPGAVDLTNRAGISWCPTPGEACVALPDGLLAAPDRALWLVASAPNGRPATARGSRYVLGAAPARVTVTASSEAAVEVAGAPGPVIVVATAAEGQPGLRLGDGEAGLAWGTAVVNGAALAVQNDGAPSLARVLAATRGADAPLEVTLTRAALAAPIPGALAGGVGQGTLAPGAGWVAAVPGGDQRVRITLAEGLVAVLTADGAPPVTLWAGDGPLDAAVEGAFATLTVLNPTTRATPWSARFTPLGGAPEVLAVGGSIERVALAGGMTRLETKAAPGATLHLRGAAAEAVWVDTNGAVARGLDLRLGARPGRVEVRHGAGPWAAWVDGFEGAASEAEVVWGGKPPDVYRPVGPAPAQVPLDGPVAALRVDAAGPGLVRLAAGQPVVAIVRADGAPARALLAFDGVVEVPVNTAGPVDIALRPVGGGALRGAASVDVVSATPLAEGLGAEALLAGGGSLAYGFTVERAGPVGIGVRADASTLAVTLRGPDGAAVGTGVAMMPVLAPGAYLLTATLPADAAPARVRPALVGLTPPDTGPPEEVVRAFLQDIGVLPAPPAPPVEENE